LHESQYLGNARVPDAWTRDDEIDLRQYLDVLIRWWREILLITFVVVVLAVLGLLAIRWLMPPTYVASADVAIARTVSDVSFDERFVTTSDEIGADTVSTEARRNALMGLVATGGIASEVINELGNTLSEGERASLRASGKYSIWSGA
jgi:capsular polysaccharide biosynthesis protein